MSRLYRAVDVIFLVFGALVVYLALELSYHAEFGPGPGFFSFWLGALMIGLALIDIIGTLRQPQEPLPPGFIPDRDGIRRVLYIVGALVATLFLLKPLGWTLTIFCFSIFLLQTMGRQAWWLTLLLSLVSSFGTFHLFRQLQVFLPTGILGI
jgi:putative tricarboxylic transport membrane protein